MTQLQILERTPLRWRADVAAGCHILAACDAAVQLAQTAKVEIAFKFNDIELVAVEGSSSDQLAAHYNAESDRRYREWQNSDAAKQQAAERLQKLGELQIRIDQMLVELNAVRNSQADLIVWIGRFAELNDHVDLSFDKQALAASLEDAGYSENTEVGNNSEEIRADKTRMARYIVGQAINNLRRGWPIHPICSKFAAEYATDQLSSQ